MGNSGEEVCIAVLGFLNSGFFDPAINKTFVALIPKKKKPTSVAEFRPITLCNVLYKIIAKMLANRLKKVLNSIISPTQSAFIPGHLIIDNLLVAFEALHTMNGRLKGRKGFMALKLDRRMIGWSGGILRKLCLKWVLHPDGSS